MASKLVLYFPDIIDYFLVYTGRELNKTDTFRDQFVEDQS